MQQTSADGPKDNVVSGPVTSGGKCLPCKAEKSATRKYRWKVIGGLMLPFALQALDVTM
jgi:hypothetical protein